ncbi:MAG TPA: aldose 1-epimerase [Candidatus Limnocylindrales bacterium]|nr:aldose 1-epimerase [Candidatus Limnocylindrales bacterium]
MTARILHASEADFPARTLVSPDRRLDATFLPTLNMLCTSLVHDGEQLLHLRAGIAAYAERAKTCGIPFLHPWANRLSGDTYEACGARVDLSTDGEAGARVARDANGLPNHGLLGGRTPWEITSETSSATAALLTARFRFESPALLASFPFPHDVTMRISLSSAELAVTTTIEATSERPVPVSFGYHPYFQLPGIRRESWIVELPVRRRLVLDARSIPTGEMEDVTIPRAPLAGRTYDDGFTGIIPPGVFAIEGGGRRIEVELAEGYPYVQIFAPAGAEFFCIEPMTAPANALGAGRGFPVAERGRPFEATFRVRVLG